MPGLFIIGISAAAPLLRFCLLHTPLPKIAAMAAYRSISTQLRYRTRPRIPIDQVSRLSFERPYHHSKHLQSTARRIPMGFPEFHESSLQASIREMIPELRANLRDTTTKSEETKPTKECEKIEAIQETNQPMSPEDITSRAGDITSEEERAIEKYYNIIALYDLKGALPKPLASLVGKELGNWIVENLKHDLDVKKLGVMVQEANDKMDNQRFMRYLIFWTYFVGGVGGYVLLDCYLDEVENEKWALSNEIAEKEKENEEQAKQLQSKDVEIERLQKIAQRRVFR